MNENLSPVVYLLGIVLTGIFSANGIKAIVNARRDRKSGVATKPPLPVTTDDILAKRWQALNEAQVKVLIDPLQKRVDDMEKELATVKASLEKINRKYWASITFIRLLQTWISRAVPPEIAEKQPAPPPVLIDDI